MFATAVLIQRETGGNLGEVLTNISAMLRERFRIQGELRTLTAHVRLSAKILGGTRSSWRPSISSLWAASCSG
jgi:tight adherence protein B